MDDGTVCRLDDETLLRHDHDRGLGGRAAVAARWLAEWALEVRITDLTGTLAAMNLAGPRSREALAAAHPYRPQRRRVPLPARAHRAASRGSSAWCCGSDSSASSDTRSTCPRSTPDTCGTRSSARTRESKCAPRGSRRSASLRLEKQHLIPSQDTDSESTPFGAGLSWIVKLDKEGDFLGRWSLEMAAGSLPAERLVGFTASPGMSPEEGAAVVVDGAPAGRVTSCRLQRRARPDGRHGMGPAGARRGRRRDRDRLQRRHPSGDGDDGPLLRP